MAKGYTDYLDIARNHRMELDNAIANRNSKDILYHRGKYLIALRQAHKMNPTAVIPSSVTGLSSRASISDVIETELENHQDQIDRCIKDNKRNSSIKNNTISNIH